MQQVKIIAYQLGEKILLKNFIAAYQGFIYFSSSTEVFIRKGDTSYIYLQNYGEVVFSDCEDSTIADFIEFVKPFVSDPVNAASEFKEEFSVEVSSERPLLFDYNSIQVPIINADVLKIIMLNVSQSVVLDYFTELSQKHLNETAKYTKELEKKGKLNISKINLTKFIGKTLATQNRIVDNLYLLDAPDTVWNDEYLAEINNGLARLFKLRIRFREVEYTLKIIDSNLSVFLQLIQQRESKKLDWIIIFLILFEILNALFGRHL